ncbi:MAG: AMP-binding protein, partial [Planctomycetota bacterium]
MNVGAALLELGHEAPQQLAVVAYKRTRGVARKEAPRTETNYASLCDRAVRIALGFRQSGLVPGDRVSVFVRPSADLVAVTWAAFLEGLVPVFIDPGLARPALLSAIERTAPRAMVGVREAQLARRIFPRSFRSIERSFLVGSRRLPFLGRSLDKLCRSFTTRDVDGFTAREMPDDAPAAILFTSGSTGPAKGVLQTHASLRAQVDALQELFAFRRGEADLAGLPAFALFAPAFGLTAVFPDMDPTQAEKCDPARLANAILENETSNAFGSPTIWKRLVPWCRERGVRFESLERVLIAGAAVPPALLEDLASLLPNTAEIHTPYGATEALPVASIRGSEIGALDSRPGKGTCVGRPAGAEVRLIEVRDEVIADFSEAREVANGEVGEICVRGPFVSAAYADLPEATKRAKIRDAANPSQVWHRMGDLGSIDAD